MSTVLLNRKPTTATPLRVTKIETKVRDLAAVAMAEEMRWVRYLVTPFVLGAVFFGAAIGTGTEWLMGLAFGLGPEVMICAYIYLAISSDSEGLDLADEQARPH